MNYLIIGSGTAGVSAVKKILANSDDEDKITLISKESYPFYYRPRLIECLSGSKSISEIIIHDEDWFEKRNVDLRLKEEVIDLNPEKKQLTTRQDTYKYDKLLLANGAHSFVPPIPGADKENVFTLRNAEDAVEIYNQTQDSTQAVVIGGGLLGLESAYNLHQAGLEVKVIEVQDWLLPRQLDKEAGNTLQQLLEEKGLKFCIGKETAKFVGENQIEGIKLGTGEFIKADMALLSTGVRSNIDILEDIEDLEIDRAVVVNKHMETSKEDIYAAGDIAICEGNFYGLWQPAKLQGEVAGINMAGGCEKFEHIPSDHRLKVVGVEVISTGKLDNIETHEVSITNSENGYKKIVKDKNGNKIGAMIVGNFADTNDIIQEIE